VKKIAVLGAGIVGICSAYFLQKTGYKVTLIDKEEPGTMTSYGHACTFADYANVPVNSPSLFKTIPSMLLREDGPLAVDFFYVIKNLPWALKFLNNCRKVKVEEIAASLANLLQHARLSYDHIFEEVNVSQYIKNDENIYIYESKQAYEESAYSTLLRKKNNIKVIHPGINFYEEPDEINIKAAEKIFKDSFPCLITVARFDKRKGHDKTIMAIRNLKEKFPKIKYVCIGHGSEEKNLKKLVHELNLENIVIFMDNINPNFKSALIKKSNLFVMPSIIYKKSVEGFGIAFIEAGQHGIPSIGGKDGGASDAIIHNKTGLICNGNDLDSIYQSIIKIFIICSKICITFINIWSYYVNI